MENHIVYLGIYNLFNISIDLVLKIQLGKDNKSGQFLRMMIPLPENYPLTEVGTSEIVKSKGLFEVEFLIIGPRNKGWIYYQINSIEVNTKRSIILNKFYNIAKSENIKITPEESFIFNGLGKTIISLGFPYLIKYFNIDLDKTPIVLEASGGAIRNDNDEFRIQQYLNLNRNDVMQTYKNKYPDDFDEMYEFLDKYSDLELAETLVSLENNHKLIQYYTSAFGFQPITYISTETLMSTLVSTFIKNYNL